MYNTIKLEKGLYSITGKTFTQALEQLDPDKNYSNTELSSLDAFERQLKRFDIKVSGKSSDKVEKFFASTESAVLFPEYVRRTIKQGMDEASILSEVVAAVSYTDSIDFRGLSVTNGGDNSGVAQGGTIPSSDVRLASNAKTLTKFARKLSCSYESIRKQRLEAFGVILKSLGTQISRAINSLAVTELSNGITATTIAGTTITYADLAAFWASMNDNDMTTMVCSPATMAKILAFEEMKYCVSDYMSSGMVKTPYGVTIVKCSSIGSEQAIGIDKNCAAEMIFGTDIIVDFDKLITTQCDEISCSVMVGFSRLTDSAVKVLNTSK